MSNILNNDVLGIIFDYVPYYELLEWMDINKLEWNYLSGNPNAIHLLEKHPEKIDWDWLSQNSSIFKLIDKKYIISLINKN